MNEITRQSVDALIASGDYPAALAQIKTLYALNPTLSAAQFVLDRVPKIVSSFSSSTFSSSSSSPAGHSFAKPLPCRVALLRSFTIEPIVPLLRASALLHGLEATVWVGEFNAYAQEMLTGGSALYQFEPDIVALAVQTRDLVPDIWQRFADLSRADVDAIVGQALHDLRTLLAAFRANSKAHLIIPTLELPFFPAASILDNQNSEGQIATILKLNTAIQRLAQEHPGVYVLDYEGLMARYGRERWHDERKWLTMRMPIAVDALNALAQEYIRFLLPLMGRTCKALVVDLDNTLWGGVIGEDGLHGIKIGAEYPGAAFLQVQRAILDLYQRGVILAVCSKNNPSDVTEVFENRAEMLLKPHHFAALRINWQDKAQNLREIAAELNIGIDALAFLDDNPVERQRVQTELPEVTVLELPADPMQYAPVLRACPVFERLTLSAEDRERGRYYAEQRQRQELEQTAGTVEDFLRSLRMTGRIEGVTPATLARVAQLTQKTNQFNTTTRRYSEQQITEMSQSAAWEVMSLSLQDRFGDNGLVGIAILHHAETMPEKGLNNGLDKGLNAELVSEIDTFLLSCRVIGRTAETALLAYLADKAHQKGATWLEGWFLPTRKNAPAQDFYPTHGFERYQETEEGSLWRLDLRQTPLQYPAWIAITATEGEPA